jgi:hypothetical protein
VESAQQGSRSKSRTTESPTPAESIPPTPQVAAGDAVKLFEEVYQKFMQALMEAWSPGDVQKQLEEAYRSYMQTLLDIPPQETARRFDAYCKYMQTLIANTASEDAANRFEEAYRSYVRALREVWAQVDASTLDPGTLATIGQSQVAVACYAYNALASRYQQSA